jgi:hypothetical protein
MRDIDTIVVHTAGSYDSEDHLVVHQAMEVVRHFHMMPLAKYDRGVLVKGTGGNGWSEIGYHRYIEQSGLVRTGRADERIGAHVQGFNLRSLGICCSGHGDYEPLNDSQRRSLVSQCAAWCRLYGIHPDRVIGHRETPRYTGTAVTKSCPGKNVDMDPIRASVRDARKKGNP